MDDVGVTEECELKLYQRLEAFRRAHKLTDARMSAALGTKIRTYRGWKYEKHTPPAAVAQLLALFEISRKVRVLAGATPEPRPHGRPFAKGYPWRLTSERARAIAETRWGGNNG